MTISNKSIGCKAKVYIAAEIHGVKNNSKIKYELLCNLNCYSGVTFFFVEMGCYEAEGLNQFLITGDVNILKKTIDNRESCYANMNEELKFWSELYKFNLLLPQDRKIKIVGIDCNGRFCDLILFARYLNRTAKIQNHLKKSIEKDLFMLEAGLKHGECFTKLIILTESIINKIEHLDTITIEKFKVVLEEIYTKLHRLSNPDCEKMVREEYMAKRLITEMQKNPQACFFGQLGYAHVYKINKDLIPLAEHIEQILKKSELVVKIMYIYKDTVYQKKVENAWIQCGLNMLDLDNNITRQLLENGEFPLVLLENKKEVETHILKASNKGFYIVI